MKELLTERKSYNESVAKKLEELAVIESEFYELKQALKEF